MADPTKSNERKAVEQLVCAGIGAASGAVAAGIAAIPVAGAAAGAVAAIPLAGGALAAVAVAAVPFAPVAGGSAGAVAGAALCADGFPSGADLGQIVSAGVDAGASLPGRFKDNAVAAGASVVADLKEVAGKIGLKREAQAGTPAAAPSAPKPM